MKQADADRIVTASEERRCALCGELLDDRVLAGQLRLPLEGWEGAPALTASQLVTLRHCSLTCADAHVTALMTCLGQLAPPAPFADVAAL